jgi:hypothetical protein
MKTISNQDSVSAFSITLDNSTVTSATQYRMFDSDLVLSAINGSLSSATSTTIETTNTLGRGYCCFWIQLPNYL